MTKDPTAKAHDLVAVFAIDQGGGGNLKEPPAIDTEGAIHIETSSYAINGEVKVVSSDGERPRNATAVDQVFYSWSGQVVWPQRNSGQNYAAGPIWKGLWV